MGAEESTAIVLTADLSYEPHTDRVVAATFGRGIYALVGATKVLEAMQAGRA